MNGPQATRNADGKLCVLKEEMVQSVVKEPILKCTLKNVEKCHYTYITQFTPIREEVMVFCYQNCSELLWEKNCSIDWEKLLKFKAEGWRQRFDFFWDHYNNLFEHWKVSTIFEREYFFDLFLEVSQI